MRSWQQVTSDEIYMVLSLNTANEYVAEIYPKILFQQDTFDCDPE
jgi:hypothetical protein